MGLPEGEKCPFTRAVHTGDTVQIDLSRLCRRTALRGCVRQAVCPFPDQLPAQDNLYWISEIEDCGS